MFLFVLRLGGEILVTVLSSHQVPNQMDPGVNAEGSGLTPSFDHEALKAAIRECLERVFADPDQISRFFTNDYVQTTDGITCDRQEFERHVRHLSRVAESVQFEVLEALQQGERIADRHSVRICYKDGRTATLEVFLFASTFDGRLHRVDEVTRITSGDPTLKDAAITTGDSAR